jgi:hypothetical protein
MPAGPGSAIALSYSGILATFLCARPLPYTSDPVAQLCPACGLCCNGVLFADVELTSGDNPAHLGELGLTVKKKGRKLAFSQPCACFDGKLCTAYAGRPGRCRTFECRLLLQTKSGDLNARTALKTISQTRARVELVRKLIRALGNSEEGAALTHRYAKVMAEPMDLGAAKVAQDRSRLLCEMAALMESLHRDFLT